ncbi:MAG TPA: hypothetical protein VK914_09725 [bacterium]|jgi:hypothetical protein|nr:hypothetical protein [bacterium]
MKKFMSAVFLGLFFLKVAPLSAEVIVAVPGIEVGHPYHHRHHHHHWHRRHEMHGGPTLIIHP